MPQGQNSWGERPPDRAGTPSPSGVLPLLVRVTIGLTVGLALEPERRPLVFIFPPRAAGPYALFAASEHETTSPVLSVPPPRCWSGPVRVPSALEVDAPGAAFSDLLTVVPNRGRRRGGVSGHRPRYRASRRGSGRYMRPIPPTTSLLRPRHFIQWPAADTRPSVSVVDPSTTPHLPGPHTRHHRGRRRENSPPGQYSSTSRTRFVSGWVR